MLEKNFSLEFQSLILMAARMPPRTLSKKCNFEKYRDSGWSLQALVRRYVAAWFANKSFFALKGCESSEVGGDELFFRRKFLSFSAQPVAVAAITI